MKPSIRKALVLIKYELLTPQSRTLIIVWAMITILIAWAMSIGAVQIQSGSSGVGGVKAHVTSEFAQALQSAVVAILIDGFFFAVLAGMSVPRDHESRVMEIERSCGLTSRSYVIGKFTGATVWLVLMLCLQILARIFFNHILPNADMDESRGTFHLLNYLRPMLVIILPGLLFNGSIAFYLGARTRNSVLVFLSPVVLMLVYSFVFSETLLAKLPLQLREIIRLGEPSGTEWLNQTYLREDRGAAYYNQTPIGYHLDFLISRSIFLLASSFLVLLSSRYAMNDITSKLTSKRRKLITGTADETAGSELIQPDIISLKELGMTYKRPSIMSSVMTIAKLESAILLRGPGLWLFGIIIALISTISAVMTPGPLGTTILVTSGNFAGQTFPIVTFCTCLLALFFGTDAMERDRITRTETFIFGSPIRTISWIIGKSIACSFAGFSVVLSTFIGLCISLAWQGEVWPEIWPLFCIWGLLLIPTFFFWSSLIGLIRAFTPNRTTALAIGFLMIALTVWANIKGYNNWATNWALNGPTVIWSDISQFELQRVAIIGNRLTTFMAGVFLLCFASLRLNRVEPDVIASRSRRKFLIISRFYAPAIIAILPCLCISGWLYFQIRQGPQGAVIRKQNKDYWKRNVSTFFEFKSPTIDETTIDMRLSPATGSFELTGHYIIRNNREDQIQEFPITVGSHFRDIEWELDDQPYKPEERAGLIIFKKPDSTPFKPGEVLRLGFQYHAEFPGGMSKNGSGASEFIVPSGVVLTSFSQSFLPKLGFIETLGLEQDMTPDGRDYPEDYYKEKVDPALGDGSKMKTSVSISVPSDFRANSVGVLESITENQDGTRKYNWKSDHPVSFFNIVAGRWVEAKGEGVTVYHDSRHGRNVPEMVRALEASRKYFSEWFGEFPWKELKLSEFPGLASYAQGFPTNITFSESIGFLTLSRPESNVAFYVTAHEAAHQWWGNLLVPGKGPGGNILSEALANYSAIILIDKVLGEEARLGLTKEMELDYIRQRQGDDERPLVKIDGRRATDQSITYSRGGWVFWMLSNSMGRENFNKALAEMIRKYPAGSEDAPLVEDLLETARSFAPDQLKFEAFARDWIKGTALPNLFLENVKLEQGDNKTWKTTGTLRNEGSGTAEIEIAASLGERFTKKSDKSLAQNPYQQSRTKVVIEPGKSVDFQVNSDFKPEMVTVDPDLKLLIQGRDRIEKKL